jgi:uncharacterized protein (DUF2336 family)
MTLRWGTDMQVNKSLISDLEDAIKTGSSDKRVETLRRVTDLFLGDADRLNEVQIGVFDDVLCHLIQRIESRAVAELSARLAPVDNAPIEVIRRLAREDEISIAGPVLTQSSRLTTSDLVEIAQTKGQSHLLAISGRAELEPPVTDQLLSRGNSEVVHKLATNAGARFSEAGFVALVKNAENDEALAKGIGARIDLPMRLLRELLLKATEAVRAWLLSNAPPEARNEVQRVLADASNEIGRQAIAPRDFTQAEKTVLDLHKRGELTDAVILNFAIDKKYEEMVAALSAASSSSLQLIAALMRSHKSEGLLVACKAAGLKWPTLAAILTNRFSHHATPKDDLAQAKVDFINPSQATAQRTLRFWQVRAGTKVGS